MKKINMLMSIIVSSITIAPIGLNATPFNPVTSSYVESPSVVAKPVFKIGNPYHIKGVSYTPTLDTNYDEIGVASWYGADFHGKLTSNGEIFNKDLVTAASTVLPLPSIVEITNLENGKKLLVRVNDRGPYTNGRIIDVSEKAAEILGFKDSGTAKVRVTLIPDLSTEVAKQMPNYNQVLKSLEQFKNNTVNYNNIMQPSVSLPAVPVETSVTKDGEACNNVIRPIKVNDKNLKQVNLLEPNSVQQYIPRGVFVQIGAFDQNNSKIREDINSLSRVGVVTLQNVDINGKNVLRVRVGPYGSIEDASKIRSSLVKLGYEDPRVVIEE